MLSVNKIEAELQMLVNSKLESIVDLGVGLGEAEERNRCASEPHDRTLAQFVRNCAIKKLMDESKFKKEDRDRLYMLLREDLASKYKDLISGGLAAGGLSGSDEKTDAMARLADGAEEYLSEILRCAILMEFRMLLDNMDVIDQVKSQSAPGLVFTMNYDPLPTVLEELGTWIKPISELILTARSVSAKSKDKEKTDEEV